MSVHHIGTGFLGDVQRQQRIFGTPPASPPAYASASSHQRYSPMPEPMSLPIVEEPTEAMPPPKISPEVSLDLRLRWLEALVYGSKETKERRNASRTQEKRNSPTLVRGVDDLQQRLSGIVQTNDGLKRFMDHYEQHANLLTPTFALSATLPMSTPSYENMTSSELEAFLAEMDPDIRAADRDLREIEILEKKEVTAAGKLPEHAALQPRLDALMKAQEEDLLKAAELEGRIASIMDRYATNVDALSELFVAWDDSLRTAERSVVKLEKDLEDSKKLGYV